MQFLFVLFAAAQCMLLRKRAASPILLGFGVQHFQLNVTDILDWLELREELASLQDSYEVRYILPIYLGSDGQEVYVLLDTGSSDTWTYGTSAPPHNGGNYNPMTSSSARRSGLTMKINYDDGSKSVGEYYYDKFAFEKGNVLLDNFQFANVNQTNSNQFGFLGVADKNQEATGQQYDNLPWALANNGIIPKASYSLYLNNQGMAGNIVFGGIDTAKMKTPLTFYKRGNRNDINLESILVDGKEFTYNKPGFLDSGTLFTLLPPDLVAYLDTIFQPRVQKTSWSEDRYVSCDQPSDKFIDFNFGDNVISISYKDFTVSGTDCRIGYLPLVLTDPTIILGDLFLRSAYVYYDLSDQRIGIAQVEYSDDTNIVEA